jgi:peptidoglycan/xylan/chitin deacetylase (PgdA/CDA1 family)
MRRESAASIAAILLVGATSVARALEGGIVTIMFDDGYESVHDVARPILKKFGFTSTDFIVSGFLGKSEALDHPVMTKSELDDLVRDGDEIESHSDTHPHLTRLTSAELKQELSRSKAALEAWYGPIDSFALPYGESNAAVLAEVKKYYRYCRTSRAGENDPSNFDPYRIRVQVATNATTLAEVRGWLVQARRSKAWLAILYHDVGAREGGEYTVPTERFEAQMRAVRDSGLPVMTMRQAVGEMRSGPAK